MLDYGADVNNENKKDSTLFIILSQHGHLKACKIFLNGGVNVSYKDIKGSTVLHMVAYNRNLEVCRLLLERGTDIRVKTNLVRLRLNCAHCYRIAVQTEGL